MNDNTIEIQQKASIVLAYHLGFNIFRNPINVFLQCHYLVSQFTTNVVDPRDNIVDIIKGILNNKINIFITIDKGYSGNNYLTQCRFFGSSENQIPVEHLKRVEREKLLYCIGTCIKNHEYNFDMKGTSGLRGEAFLSHYKHNNILSSFFDPFYFILTIYYIFIDYLFKNSGLDKEGISWVIERIIKPLSSDPKIHQDCLRPIRCIEDPDRKKCLLKQMNMLYLLFKNTKQEDLPKKLKWLWITKSIRIINQNNIKLEYIKDEV